MTLAAARSPVLALDPVAIIDLLHGCLARTLRPEAMAWLDAEFDTTA